MTRAVCDRALLFVCLSDSVVEVWICCPFAVCGVVEFLGKGVVVVSSGGEHLTATSSTC